MLHTYYSPLRNALRKKPLCFPSFFFFSFFAAVRSCMNSRDRSRKRKRKMEKQENLPSLSLGVTFWGLSLSACIRGQYSPHSIPSKPYFSSSSLVFFLSVGAFLSPSLLALLDVGWKGLLTLVAVQQCESGGEEEKGKRKEGKGETVQIYCFLSPFLLPLFALPATATFAGGGK